MTIRRVLLTTTVLLCGAAAPPAPTKADLDVMVRWPDRDRITAEIRSLQHIAAPEGIEVQEQAEIGGTKQWFSIRGTNVANPVLLVIHGGPGTPMMPMSWAYQRPWEDYFTVVNWDQRGVGKNAVTADRKALQPTLTLDRMVQDGEEAVDYLRHRMHKDKIVVLGFSWGSVIGIRVAKAKPEWLSAYVGVGQAVNAGDEKYLYDRTLSLALARGDAAGIKALRAMAPYPKPDGATTLEDAMAVRDWTLKYNGAWYGHKDFDLFYHLPDWSPEYTAADVNAWGDANTWAGEVLVKAMQNNHANLEAADYKTAILFFEGRYDLFTPFAAAVRYFGKLTAPSKKLEVFERSSHMVMLDEPGRFLVKLVQDVLPLAGPPTYFARASDAPQVEGTP